MPYIDNIVVCYRLPIYPSFRPVSHKKFEDEEEKRTTIDKEVQKLTSIGFIT